MLNLIQKSLIWVLLLAFLAAIVAFMTTFTVRFNETAVVTTFGAASEESVKPEAGLYFRMPYQKVTKYDTRLRLLETPSETVQTADNAAILVSAFCAYRVNDPLLFFQRFSSAGESAESHYEKAENEILLSGMRSALGEVSRYRLPDLFTGPGGESQLPQLEADIKAVLDQDDDGAGRAALSEYGIEVVLVGIQRIVLPETPTQDVMNRMAAQRDRLAEFIESEGDAEAQKIRSQAEADATKIRAFADRRASAIRARGESEAAFWLGQMSDPRAEGLAEFNEMLRFMRVTFAPEGINGPKAATLILSLSSPGLGLMNPNVAQDLLTGKTDALFIPQDSGEFQATADNSDDEGTR